LPIYKLVYHYNQHHNIRRFRTDSKVRCIAAHST